MVGVERQDLDEILGNLIENAAKWCRRRVRISAGPSMPGQMVAVVEDDGPGLPADQRDTALKRGTRMDEATPGTGLGLSIVDELTRAYGGRVTLSDSAMEFEVRVYVNLIDERLPTTHALYSAIVTALANAGIQIPFPQRDVHVRYADPGRGAAMAAAAMAAPAPPSATVPPGG